MHMLLLFLLLLLLLLLLSLLLSEKWDVYFKILKTKAVHREFCVCFSSRCHFFLFSGASIVIILAIAVTLGLVIFLIGLVVLRR